MAMQMEIELPGLPPRRVEAAATAPVKATRSEIGYAQAVNSQWWLYEPETTPELQWPQSVAVYDQMRRTDAQITSLLEAVTLPIRRTQWRLDPAGARANVVKFVANDLGLPIVGKGASKAPARTKGKFSWPDHLRLALLELTFGHMFFEQVYAVNEAGTEAHLKKLAPRMPRTIDQITVAADGGLVSIQQYWTDINRAPQPIPVDRLVAYVRNREGGNWLGQSILRPAYKNWLLKDRLLRVQAQTIERNGMGIPLYKAQEGAKDTDLAAGKAMATAWRAGEAAGSAVPFGADLVLRGVEGTLPDADPAVRYHDEQIARAALAHFLNLGTQTGSWALGATFADFFVYSLQTLAQHIADVTTQHVIEDLVDLNFGESEPAPRLVFDEIGSQQAATAQALKTLVDAGIIHPDQVLEESSRQQYGLPPADPETATPPPGQTAPTPADATPMGAESVAATRRPARRARKARAPRRPVQARFNPAEKRDPDGKWGDGVPGPDLSDFTDGLGIDDVVPIDPGDRLGSSDRIGDDSGDADLNWVVVFSKEFGPEVRLGVTPSDESDAWKGDWETGGTAVLDVDTVAKLRTKLSSGVEQATQAARDADKAWNSGKAPTDPKLLGSEAVASGEALGGGDTEDVQWSIYLTDDDPTSWQLNVMTSPDSDGITFSPKGTKRLFTQLDRIEGELRGPLPPEDVKAAAGRRSPRKRTTRRSVRAGFDPREKRDPDGKWGDGLPGPSVDLPELDLEGFDLASEVEGTFGTLRMGVDLAGDVRVAFHQGSDARALDLSGEEAGQLRDVLDRLANTRDDMSGDETGVVDEEWFGFGEEHRVQLLGNGLISVAFFADDDDPWELNLDPPDGEGDDVATVTRALDEVQAELAREVRAAAGVDTHPGGEQLKHYWLYGEGAAKWSTWTELYDHLRKYLAPGMAKRTAAAWYHERFGIWPGSDLNRVKHGKPPRGQKVGPG